MLRVWVASALVASGQTKAPREAGLVRRRLQAASVLHDIDELTVFVAASLKRYFAIDQCKQRMVAPQAHTVAGMKLGTALAHDDITRTNRLAAVELHAQVLGIGVAAVTAGTYAFLMCHGV